MRIVRQDDEPRVPCETCGNDATCFGSYEVAAFAFACDACCGHGCEDGKCWPVQQQVDGTLVGADVAAAVIAEEGLIR